MVASNEEEASPYAFSYTDQQTSNAIEQPVVASSSHILTFSNTLEIEEVLGAVVTDNDYEMYTVDVNNMKREEKPVQNTSAESTTEQPPTEFCTYIYNCCSLILILFQRYIYPCKL